MSTIRAGDMPVLRKQRAAFFKPAALADFLAG